MAKKRNGRQDAIRDIVRNKDVRTQLGRRGVAIVLAAAGH